MNQAWTLPIGWGKSRLTFRSKLDDLTRMQGLSNSESISMNATIKLCLVLHNHQPIGNFDGVIEQAYRDSYLPFLDVFEPYTNLKIALHTSGPLMLWLEEKHPEYLAAFEP